MVAEEGEKCIQKIFLGDGQIKHFHGQLKPRIIVSLLHTPVPIEYTHRCNKTHLMVNFDHFLNIVMRGDEYRAKYPSVVFF